MTSSCTITSQRFQELLEAYSKIKFNGEQEKESIICVMDGQTDLWKAGISSGWTDRQEQTDGQKNGQDSDYMLNQHWAR